jgi:hypothetical protein
MRTILAAALALGVAAAPLAAADATKGEWTGYITDTHCGTKGAVKDHSADCVQKCMKGGSKAQIHSESDQKLYNLDSFDKVKDLMGAKVTVKGTLDPATNTITVDSAARAASK